MGTVRLLPANSPTPTVQSLIPAEEHYSKIIFFHRNTSSLLTKSSLVIIKISEPSPKVTSCRLKPEPAKTLPNTTILHCKASIAWKCADLTKKLYKRQQDWPVGQSVQLPARLPASPRVGTPSSLIQKIKISYEKASKGWGLCFL